MSARRIRGTWDLVKTKLKEAYPTLTDADLSYQEGKPTEMLKRIERLLGKSPIQIAWLVEEATC